ncbi:uncharacterized protein LOC113664440 [Pocillopora damicornis]|uniref:uncharacterized protein LOC113664440 n=1 Tax=Pocillopora damicornis TaxID=46731 RepID=UPI000F54CD56|nr:uncharacterized protein LOC113664440 [Pocillopora damicornis]
MKRFVMLLIFLAVANSFPLKNEENAALKTKVLGPRVLDACKRRILPNRPIIDTPLNHPARQSGWGSNVGWSSMDVNVGGGQKNSKRDWGTNGKRDYGMRGRYEHKNGKSIVGLDGYYQKNSGRR